MKAKAKPEESLEQLAARGVHIPPWPRVMMDLKSHLDADDFDARSISAILARDPGVAATLFKVARSPSFNRGQRTLDRLDQVVMLLGVKQTLNLVQAVALATSLSAPNKAALNAFWSGSEELAQLAALIAEDKVSVCNIFPDQAFMAGIFRECGVPVIMQKYPDYCGQLATGGCQCWPHIFEEDRRCGTDHCAVGYLVAKHWKLPDFVSSAILYHAEMPSEELGAVRSLVAILHLASYCHSRFKQRHNALWPVIGADVLAELGIHPEDEADYCSDIVERFSALAQPVL